MTTPPRQALAETAGRRRSTSRLPRGLRNVILLVHVAAAVGWLGVTSTFLVLTVSLLDSRDPATLRVGYAVHELMVTWLARPAALLALGTGLVLAVGTGWSPVRHWWVPAKLALLVATVVLTITVSPTLLPYAVEHAADAGTPAYTDAQQTLVLMALYHVVMIGTALALAVFKPGRRERRRLRRTPHSPDIGPSAAPREGRQR